MQALLRSALPTDIIPLANRLRTRDIAEIRAASGLTPEAALLRSLNSASMAWTAEEADGTPVCMCGVSPYLPGVGSPWLLATDQLHKYKRQLIAATIKNVASMHMEFPLLVNFVDARNLDSLRYLQMVGFSVDKFIPAFGFERRPFFRFSKVDPCA